MNNYLRSIQKYCTGCTACCSVCPCDSIDMLPDEDGNIVAVIDKNTCIDCGKCREICPLLNKVENKEAFQYENELYAVWANGKVRLNSSSGGVFTVIANSIFNENGIIYAVVYDENFHAVFKRIISGEELKDARGSKYIQSELKDTFNSVEKDLQTGAKVCFVGLPCQIAGLKAFLGKEYDNLLLVDMLCNFAPPYSIFKKYLNEDFATKQIKNIKFRTKEFGWVADVFRVTYEDETISFQREGNDWFQRGYHRRLFMPKKCENCHFSSYPRLSDITIGDFWHIEDYDPNLNDGAGTSICLINSKRGQTAFESFSNDLEKCINVPFELLNNNRREKELPHVARDRFYRLVKKYSFDKAVDYALNAKYDVAVLGVWSEDNYGSELTYFALYSFLKSHELEVLMVERPKRAPWHPNETPVLFDKCPYEKDDISPLFDSVADMHKLNSQCNSFVLGSDQMWHSDLFEPFGEFAFLDFIHEDKNKISYATSFGKEIWDGSESQRALIAYYLDRLNYVSVREKSGINICKQQFSIEAEWMLDPVFLCEKKQFKNHSTKPVIPDDYIAVYVLDPTEEKQKALRWLSDEYDMPLNIITDARNPRKALWNLPVRFDAKVEDWLGSIINAKYVVTDSFHGMCFACLFHKPFIAFINETRGAVRFKEYLELFEFEQLAVWDPEEVIKNKLRFENVDWNKFEKILEPLRQKCRKWLLDAVSNERNEGLSTFDILGDRIAELQKYKPQIMDNSGMIQHHENVFRDAFDQINQLRSEVESLKLQIGPFGRVIRKLRNIKSKNRN